MSVSGEIRARLRVLYGGKFELNARKKLVYKNQKQCKLDPIDPDLISKVVLEDTFQSDIPLPKPVKEFWYLEPGKTIDDGLHRVDNDKDSMEMVKYSDRCQWIHVYVVQDGEFGPSEVKNKIQTVEVETSMEVEIVSDKPVLNAPRTHGGGKNVQDGLESIDESDGLLEVLGCESSNDGSAFSDEEGLGDDESNWQEGSEFEEPEHLGEMAENLGEEPQNLVEEPEHLGEVPEKLDEVPEKLGNLDEMAENYG